jgi:hypothetical protein
MGEDGQETPWRFDPQEREPVPTTREAEWTLWPVWTCAQNIASSGIRSPEPPARNVVAIQTTLSRPTNPTV